MSKKLYEYIDPRRAQVILEHIGEGVDKKAKDLFMSGIFVQAERRNQNERVYPLQEITNAVTGVRKKLAEGQSILGELDHPEELSINLDRVSHVIVDMWMNGNDGHGKLKVLPTPTGEIARALLESGVILGVSSRGSGNVGDDGRVSDFDMITVDIVAQPSAPEAYPKSIYESLYNMRGGSTIMEIATAVSYKEPRADLHLQREIMKFIKELRK
jgi:hypothetical protein